MATYQELANDLRDATGVDVSDIDDAPMLGLCRLVVRDIINRGALIDLDTAEITLASSTWEYDIPANYIYIHHLAFEDDSSGVSTYDEWVPGMHWDMIRDGGTPKVTFHRDLFYLRVDGTKVRFFGQGRPGVPTALSGFVDPELEGLIQAGLEQRMLSRLSQQGLTQAQGVGIDRANQRREKFTMFDEALSHVDFRVRPNSRRVRGR